MKFLPAKLERKLHRLKKHSRSPLKRKLDVMHENARNKVFQQSCDAYKDHKKSEYECRKRTTKMAGGSRETFLSDGSFHQSVGRVLLVAEFFAMMPVKGVTGKHPGDLSFSWRNVRTGFSLVFIASSLANFGLSLFKVLNNPISFNSVKPIIFRGSVLLVLIVALRLAQQWPNLMMYWHEVEQGLPQYPSQLAKCQMGHTIRMVMLVGMMLSFAEHLLSMISAINYASYCNSTADPIKNYFLRTNDEIFYVTSYSTTLAMWGKFQNVYSTFIWNYMDVFVMIVSIGLAAKFRQLNNDLKNFKGMHMAPSYWSERRIQYRNICILCDRMDDAISLITMVSFSNNLYFICVQLLRSLNTMPSVAHAVYFYFSLTFLIGRTLAVSLYSASVHDESRVTLRYLRCVPKDSWCPEVKRFSEEIISDEVALSGMKFFHLTRKLVLSVAGTIVTYELVLIQFHEDNGLWDCNQSYYS
ncbi:gustatory receptor for sugar taste 64f [Drosophila obscura]|uniref:gustatory receptor for sugar taste 64f n=1 Tax=Drosophila obscura TaxID=7282 RepID=UPI001BB142AB|nr:gustatory receptor for sugar taste 64f [Drosophila obscura]